MAIPLLLLQCVAILRSHFVAGYRYIHWQYHSRKSSQISEHLKKADLKIDDDEAHQHFGSNMVAEHWLRDLHGTAAEEKYWMIGIIFDCMIVLAEARRLIMKVIVSILPIGRQRDFSVTRCRKAGLQRLKEIRSRSSILKTFYPFLPSGERGTGK